MASKNKTTIAIRVNGEPTLVETNLNAPLGTIIPKALEQTQNTGQPPENWELRDAQGNELDLHKKIEDHDFPEDVVLKLNLKAGIGG